MTAGKLEMKFKSECFCHEDMQVRLAQQLEICFAGFQSVVARMKRGEREPCLLVRSDGVYLRGRLVNDMDYDAWKCGPRGIKCHAGQSAGSRRSGWRAD